VQGCDIVSFDVYPIAGPDRKDAADLLWYVPKGVDRLIRWTGGPQPLWNCIERTHISNPRAKASPYQVKAEVCGPGTTDLHLLPGGTGSLHARGAPAPFKAWPCAESRWS
jgi:hypothetical protein